MTQHPHYSPTQAPSTGNTQSGGRLFPTQTHLSQSVRVPIVELLNRTLADTMVLMTHAKYAHWNVKGMEFYGLHQLFDEIAELFETHVDLVGERITALGGEARGTVGMAVSNCRLPSMPTDATTGVEFIEILADRLAIHDANLSDAIETAQSYGDTDTADLLNEVSREVSQHLWFLEAHLQSRPAGGVPTSGSTEVRTSRSAQQPPMQGPQQRERERRNGNAPAVVHGDCGR